MSSAQARPPMPKTRTTLPKNSSTKTSAPKTNTPKNSLPEKPIVAEPVAKPEPLSPPAWVGYVGPVWSGIKAATQAFAIAYTMLTLLVLVAVLADSNDASWGLALTGATRFWLLAHGSRATFGALHLNILPLGLTALCLVLIRLTAKRASHSLGALIGGALAYSFFTTLASRIIGEPPNMTSFATLGALVIGGLGFSLRLLPIFPWFQKFWGRLPQALPVGLRASGIALIGSLGFAGVLAGIWSLLGFESSRAVAQTLQPGLIGSVVVGIGQLFLLPNWLIWVSGWLVGPGFTMGTGSEFAPGNWQGGPLPALPIVSALPPESWSGAYLQWIPALVLLVGAIAGWYLWRAYERTASGLRNLLLAGGVTVAGAAGGMFLLQWLARGSLGSGRLAEVGANPGVVALIFGAEIAAGIAMVLIGKYLGSRPGKSSL